jgi:hypothetical protein
MITEAPELVAELLSGSIVVRAELKWGMEIVDYLAYHPSFPEQEPGTQAPKYGVNEIIKERSVYNDRGYFETTHFRLDKLSFNFHDSIGERIVIFLTDEELAQAKSIRKE